jgi:hypothetical protein
LQQNSMGRRGRSKARLKSQNTQLQQEDVRPESFDILLDNTDADIEEVDAIRNVKVLRQRQKSNAISWDRSSEKIILEFAEKARGLSWMHHATSNQWTRLTTLTTLTSIALNTIAIVTGFAASTEMPKQNECEPIHQIRAMLYVTTIVNALSVALVAVQRYVQSERCASKHENHARLYASFARNNGSEIQKSPLVRRHAIDVVELARNEFDDLEHTAPIINNRIIKHFLAEFPEEGILPDLASRTLKIVAYRDMTRTPTPTEGSGTS